MEGSGAKLLMHYRKTALIGFQLLSKNVGTISKNLILCKQHIADFKPDVVILIDYAGFNMRLQNMQKMKVIKHSGIYLQNCGHRNRGQR